ncbi:RIP metalloprotease RseP [Puniceicoccus vermicola]|uniref:Zinc metalloprotease n=1 Tax=Puniceicoccus vermicola TaxID=388746 RepID=A0A7X1AVV2_9BACT|nr:RIP metalloprotease RseP [Puniceicoccus vermicola]MBC2600714.1 RIP metalloprotease RseP [Puniceicoccus vermicola]
MPSLFPNVAYVLLGIFLLGFCVFIHELGHFLAARRRGLKVERFSIGFGPPIVRWTRNEVEYRISWIPFGGYVALPQLADMASIEGGESSEAEKLPPISYADKMIVSVMGAVFNLIFALILSCILWIVGQEVIVTTEIDSVAEEVYTSDGDMVPGPAYEAGIHSGDRVVAVDGDPIDDWMELNNAILTGLGRNGEGKPEVDITVERNGEELTFVVNPVLITRENARDIGMRPAGDLRITGVYEEMPAFEAGIQPGDLLLKLDGEPIHSSALLQASLAQHEEGPIDLTVLRDGEEITFSMEPKFFPDLDRKLFGFQYGYQAKTEIVHRNPIQQIAIMADTVKRTLVALLHQGSDVKVRNMNGPVGIVHVISTLSHYGFTHVIWLLAFINVNLAMLNLMPVPVLDGGHMLFATIAKISGRPIPRRFMETTQGAFIVLFLSFMLYVTFYDVGRIGHDLGIGEESAPAETVQENHDHSPEAAPASSPKEDAP